MGIMEISASSNTSRTLTSCGLTDVNVVSCKGSDSKVICNETLQGLPFIFFGGGGAEEGGEGYWSNTQLTGQRTLPRIT